MSNNTATAKQIDFINRLKEDRDWIDLSLIEDTSGAQTLELATDQPRQYEAGVAISLGQMLWRQGEFTSKAASKVIDVLLAAPRKQAPAPAAAPAAEVPEGMHKVGDRIFKVQRAVHGSGHLYAKELLGDTESGFFFEYAPGAMRLLSEDARMTLEEAKQFGALYGTCCVCGRTLTNEESIEAGIGPVCAGRF